MKRRDLMRTAASVLLVLSLLLSLPALPAHAVYIREFMQGSEDTDPSPLTQEEREENLSLITAFLREDMGLNNGAVAAILANMERESGFNPGAVDPERHFFGLCQWSRLRWLKCYYFCRENDLDRNTLEGQLAFFHYELENEYSDLLVYVLQGAEDTEEGALKAQYYFCQNFEAPLEMEQEQELRSGLVTDCYWPLLTEGSLAVPAPGEEAIPQG